MRFRKDAKIELIRKVPLLCGCSKSELGRIAQLADLVEFREGQTLMREGKSGIEFFIVVEGTARVTQGGRKLTDLGPGGFVGEIALIANVPRTATVVATCPLRTLVLTRQGFSGLLYDVPSIGIKVLAEVGKRLAPETI